MNGIHSATGASPAATAPNAPASTAILRIGIDSLLRQSGVESARIEFKGSWDERTTGPQVLRTVCAFANDCQNLNGGYVVLGVAERNGAAVLPPQGLPERDVEAAQQWLRGRCRAMRPPCTPIFAPERVDGRWVLVVWVPASADRPHRAPDADGAWKYWVRIGASTVDAEKGGQLQALLEQTARVPWDDRPASGARLEDLREASVREYLRDVDSALLDLPDAVDVYRRMAITTPVNGHDAPRNVGLLFFSAAPESWFRGARIEVVRFAADQAGSVLDERIFRGPLAAQLRDCLRHLDGIGHAHIQKDRDRSQVRGWVGYPHLAVREALVNAVYHRAYRPDAVEPTKVYLYPDRIEIISYPGPVAGIQREDLEAAGRVPPVPARNRRIGEFLKELRLAEGRLTGVPQMRAAMEKNGSPPPAFDFDAQRSYFRATLPAHPEYAALAALQDAVYLRTVGHREEAVERIAGAWRANPASAALAAELIRCHAAADRLDEAEAVFAAFKARADAEDAVAPHAFGHVANVWAEALLNRGRGDDARGVLRGIEESATGQHALDSAILARRARLPEVAHRHFAQAGDAAFADARALHEFAQTKLDLAQQAWRAGTDAARTSNRRLLREARELLERVVRMDAPATRRAWAWRDLARALRWQRAPRREVEAAFDRAIALLPGERRFADERSAFLLQSRRR